MIEIYNLPLILCGIFYSILCVFSIVTGIMYGFGKRSLNPLELSDKFLEKFESKDEIKVFTIKMGWVTFFVGIVQGLTALAIFKRTFYWLAIGFTVFSIVSVLVKLKGKINIFPIIKLFFYLIILIVLIISFSSFK